MKFDFKVLLLILVIGCEIAVQFPLKNVTSEVLKVEEDQNLTNVATSENNQDDLDVMEPSDEDENLLRAEKYKKAITLLVAFNKVNEILKNTVVLQDMVESYLSFIKPPKKVQ